MKQPALILVISLLAAVVLLTGCNSPDQKMDNAQLAVGWGQTASWNKLHAGTRPIWTSTEEAADSIAANEAMFTVFKERVANKTSDVKATCEKQLAELEQKNNDMKKKLNDYNGEGKEQWETFQAAFNREMNTLGEALDDLTDTSS